MRYVIVSVVKGKAGNFNNNLRKEVFDRVKEENKEATSGDLDILKLLK